MKCPHCDETLVMTERQGIEIDYCPKCRGVWLDRGELDKIIDRSVELARPAAAPARPAQAPPPYREGDRHHEKYDQYGKKRKREGFLADLFD